ncbi:MAG: response regulator [Acidobacteria bacterium]|nr:MAG: response regulator [Acidobacteriota bacterium]
MRKVLVADDSSTIRKVVEHALTGASLRVIQASDGREALLAAERERPELILCDTDLPGLSGYEVAARVRDHEQLAGTPVILMRGTFEPFDEQRAEDCGAHGAIEKPFSLERLVELVQGTLAHAPARPAERSATVEPAAPEESAEPVRVTTADPVGDVVEETPLEVEDLDVTGVAIDDDGPLGPLGDEPQGPAAPLPGDAGFSLPGSVRRPDRGPDSDALAEEVRRQVERLAPQIIREIAWEVVPDLLERLLREARGRQGAPPGSGDADR